ncbi:MAG: thermonuclease family protein, partial [Methylotenera sp.]
VNATILGTDKYNRYLGRLQCNRVDANLYLVEHGFAWYNEKYSNDPVIQNAAVMAREKRIGLWRSKKPIPPWVWRQQHPHS